jgi:hypothetical protein
VQIAAKKYYFIKRGDIEKVAKAINVHGTPTLIELKQFISNTEKNLH